MKSKLYLSQSKPQILRFKIKSMTTKYRITMFIKLKCVKEKKTHINSAFFVSTCFVLKNMKKQQNCAFAISLTHLKSRIQMFAVVKITSIKINNYIQK